MTDIVSNNTLSLGRGWLLLKLMDDSHDFRSAALEVFTVSISSGLFEGLKTCGAQCSLEAGSHGACLRNFARFCN